MKRLPLLIRVFINAAAGLIFIAGFIMTVVGERKQTVKRAQMQRNHDDLHK
jgi:hypothetical protein